MYYNQTNQLTLFRLGFLRVARLGGRGGGRGGRKVPADYNSKTINGNGMKFGGVVENLKLINLVQFYWFVTSSLRHNNVITVNIFSFFPKSY